MEYLHFPDRPADLTEDYLRSCFTRLTERIEAAEKDPASESWIRLFSDWNDLKAYVHGEGNRRSYLLTKDMANEEADAAERFFREKLVPIAEDGNSKMVKALLESGHKEAVAAHFGPQLLRVLETEEKPLAPVNSDLRVEAGKLTNRYDKIVAKGEVEVGGEKITLAKARGLLSSEVPETRKEAYFAFRTWFLEHREEFGDIFARLVQLRDRMGRNLRFENFIPLGYLGMGRTDYGPEEVRGFRASILEHAVPVHREINEAHARALGTEVLHPWDLGFDPDLTLPSGVAMPIEGQLDKAQEVFNRLSPGLGSHFERMRKEGLIDLENRKGKGAGAYCTSFDDEGRIAIFCNSVGDQDDISTLMHEMGHAFMGWEAQKIEAVDLRWPTSDACEIHSIGMEYLSQRHLEVFFSKEDARRFIGSRWAEAVVLLCYISVVDEFQHWIYETPQASPEDRDEAWCRIHDIYMPGVDWTGVESHKYARWYAQLHIFRYPFYYIDYGIAETGAMQLALIDAEDHEKAMDAYLKLCRMGGTGSVLDIFSRSRLRSCFDPELMRELMQYARLRIEEARA